MRRLLTLATIAVILIATTSFIANFKGKKQLQDKGRIEIVFNRQLNFDSLVKIKSELSEKGILINYKSIAFDENNQLKSLQFFVDCKDGFSGGATNTNLTNQSHFGFFRDYSKTAPSPFATGELEPKQ